MDSNSFSFNNNFKGNTLVIQKAKLNSRIKRKLGKVTCVTIKIFNFKCR